MIAAFAAQLSMSAASPAAAQGYSFSPGDRDAIARVAYAEAGNQGDSGLAAVVYVILNRLASGRWGGSVETVLNAPHQFEPVLRAGGDWRNLREVTAPEQARIDTILNLARDGRLRDLTRGASYFQNPTLVAERGRQGVVAETAVNFGGASPTTVIGAHAFYERPGNGGRIHPGARDGGKFRRPSQAVRSSLQPSEAVPSRGIFVDAAGTVLEDLAPRNLVASSNFSPDRGGQD